MKKTLLFLILLVSFWPSWSGASTSTAAQYLVSQQVSDGTIGGTAVTGWAAMGLSLFNQSNSGIRNALTTSQKNLTSQSATDIERQIIALTTLRENPRTFAGVDAVQLLKNQIKSNQIGDPQLLNDDIFGLLAFRAAGESPPTAVVSGFISEQNNDGGWGIYKKSQSSSDMTAVALMALAPYGLDEEVEEKGLSYIHARQNSDGGFGVSSGDSTIGSTAWVSWMITSLGQPLSQWTVSGKTPRDYLVATQQSNGSWQSSPLLTSYVLIALAGQAFPWRGAGVATPSPSPVPSHTPSPSPTLRVNPSPTPTVKPAPVGSPTPKINFSPSPSGSATVQPLSSASPSAVTKNNVVAAPSPQASSSSAPSELTPTPSVSLSVSPSLGLGINPSLSMSSSPEITPVSPVPSSVGLHWVWFGLVVLGVHTGETARTIWRSKKQASKNKSD